MIQQIVQHSAKLIEFFVLLQLNLTKPQYRHVLSIADAPIVCEAPHKTLTTLYDLIVDAPPRSNAADCLRISPWPVEELKEPLRAFTIDIYPTHRHGDFLPRAGRLYPFGASIVPGGNNSTILRLGVKFTDVIMGLVESAGSPIWKSANRPF